MNDHFEAKKRVSLHGFPPSLTRPVAPVAPPRDGGRGPVSPPAPAVVAGGQRGALGHGAVSLKGEEQERVEFKDLLGRMERTAKTRTSKTQRY